MWDWILGIWDLIRSLLAKKADSAKKQDEEDKEAEKKRQEAEDAINQQYQREEDAVPTDGSDLVDDWKNRGKK